MSKITAARTYYNDSTISRVRIDGVAYQCFLVGLPWLGNEPEESCIPEGEYEYEVKKSPRLGRDVIWIYGVKDRTNIQWHPANYTRQLLGCEAPGDSIKFLDGDTIPDVTNSTNTLDKLLSLIDKTGTIKIIEQKKPFGVYNVG